MSDSNKYLPSGRLTDIEKITKYMKQEKDQNITLTERQELLFIRLKTINRWLMKDPPMVVVRQIRNTFENEDGQAISERTAYRYVSYSKDLFNAISTARDPEFGARLVMEWAYEARDLAIKRRDPRAYVSLIKTLIEAFGLKDKDGNQIDPEELKQNNYYIQVNVHSADGKRREKIDLNNVEDIPEEQRERAIIEVQDTEFNDMDQLIRKYEQEG